MSTDIARTQSKFFELARHVVAKQRFIGVRNTWQLFIEKVYCMIDKRFDHLRESVGGLTTNVRQMRQSMNDLVVDRGSLGRFAPHHLTIKINHALYIETPQRAIRALENEILAEAIDYINDNRYQTFAPIKIKILPDVFADGVTVEPSFGELEKIVKRKTMRDRSRAAMCKILANIQPNVSRKTLIARFSLAGCRQEEELILSPGSSRLNVGRAAENDLFLDHPSVSMVHAVLALDTNGRLVVADSGSMTGTYVNGRRIQSGKTRRVAERDVLAFGDVQVRIRPASDSSFEGSPIDDQVM